MPMLECVFIFTCVRVCIYIFSQTLVNEFLTFSRQSLENLLAQKELSLDDQCAWT